MFTSVAEQCQSCLATLRSIISTLSTSEVRQRRVQSAQVNDELERFSLWIGNIGALHRPEASLSVETRLREANDVLAHIQELLDDLNEVAAELFDIVSGKRDGMVAAAPNDERDTRDDDAEPIESSENEITEEGELLEEIGACVTRLFRISSIIRQAAPTDLFAKALSRNRYRFNDQFDIAHVGHKYPKLTDDDSVWLQKRLGHAITERRQYLSYIQDHREMLEGILTHDEFVEVAPKPEVVITKQLHVVKPVWDSTSRPSTFFTKASTLAPGRITPQMLTADDDTDPENDARSYTTISRSVDGDLDSSTTARIPKLGDLRVGKGNEVECPFCFRMKKFKNDRVWRRHVFSDLRTYVCTFPDCNAAYFGDINEWFRHEMQSHRVSYNCMLCQDKTFYHKQGYLSHVRRKHPDMVSDGNEQTILDISRKPLDQIPAQDCPCCSDWVDRLKKRAVPQGLHFVSSDILTVSPTDFKRHLAAHLEQLALFAIPIASAGDGDKGSDQAIEDEKDSLRNQISLSSLSFAETRPPSAGNNHDMPKDTNIPLRSSNEGDDPDVRLFVLDLPTNATHREIKEHFEPFGRVVAMGYIAPGSEAHGPIVPGSVSDMYPVGYIKLATREQTRLAAKNLHHANFLGKDLGVYLSPPNYSHDIFYWSQQSWDRYTPEDIMSFEERFEVRLREIPSSHENDLIIVVWGDQESVRHAYDFLHGLKELAKKRITQALQNQEDRAKGTLEQWQKFVLRRRVERARKVLVDTDDRKSEVNNDGSECSPADTERPPSYNLTVHFPGDEFSDDIILRDLPTDTTMRGLKRKLRNKIPTRPMSERIRTIHDGVIFDDASVLRFIGSDGLDGRAYQDQSLWLHLRTYEEWRDDYQYGGSNFWIFSEVSEDFLRFLRENNFVSLSQIEADHSVEIGFPGTKAGPPHPGLAKVIIHGATENLDPAVEALKVLESTFVGSDRTRGQHQETEAKAASAEITRCVDACNDRFIPLLRETTLGDEISQTFKVSLEFDMFLRGEENKTFLRGAESAVQRAFDRLTALCVDLDANVGPSCPVCNHDYTISAFYRHVHDRHSQPTTDDALSHHYPFKVLAMSWYSQSEPDAVDLDVEHIITVTGTGHFGYEGYMNSHGTATTGIIPWGSVVWYSFHSNEDIIDELVDNATKSEDAGAGFHTLIQIPRYAKTITGYVAELFAISSALHTLKEDLAEYRTGGWPERSQQDVKIVVLSLGRTIGQLENMFHRLAVPVVDADRLWQDTCAAFESEGVALPTRLEYYRTQLQEIKDILNNSGVDYNEVVEIRAALWRLLKRQKSSKFILEERKKILEPEPKPQTTRVPQYPQLKLLQPWLSTIAERGTDLPCPEGTILWATHETWKDTIPYYKGWYDLYENGGRRIGLEVLFQRPSVTAMRQEPLALFEDMAVNGEFGEAPFVRFCRLPATFLDTIKKTFDVGIVWLRDWKNPDTEGCLRVIGGRHLEASAEIRKQFPIVFHKKSRQDSSVINEASGETQTKLSRTEPEPERLESEYSEKVPSGMKGKAGDSQSTEVQCIDLPADCPAFLKASASDIDNKFEGLEWDQRSRFTNSIRDEHWTRTPFELSSDRDRYANVQPYLFNRVQLKVPEGENDYINASCITLRCAHSVEKQYIATQGPKMSTVNHFWNMVLLGGMEQGIQIRPPMIIMLTQLHELGREKCFRYYPDEDETIFHTADEATNDFQATITLTKLERDLDIRSQVRILDVKHSKSTRDKEIVVTHVLFEGWPDFAVPEDDDRAALVRLVRDTREYRSSSAPTVIHDSAGVGRTGTFIALDWLLEKLDEGELDHLSDEYDPIYEVVDMLRKQRMMMVQGEAQYLFLYEVMREEWSKRNMVFSTPIRNS